MRVRARFAFLLRHDLSIREVASGGAVKRQVQLGRTGSRFAMPEVIHGRVNLLEPLKFDLVEDFEIAFQNGEYAAFAGVYAPLIGPIFALKTGRF